MPSEYATPDKCTMLFETLGSRTCFNEREKIKKIPVPEVPGGKWWAAGLEYTGLVSIEGTEAIKCRPKIINHVLLQHLISLNLVFEVYQELPDLN